MTPADGLRTGEGSESALGNLPVQLTRLIGRERMLSDLATLLWRTRLLTLCGPGGVGKTRLAIALADAVRADLIEGAWWVDLSTTLDPAAIGQTMVSAVFPGEPVSESAVVAIGRRFAEPALIVLDNCEQVIAGCADLVAELLARSPSIRVLATSRQPLGVPGEQVFRVSGLGLGEDDGRAGDAVELFLERVREAAAASAVDTPELRDVVRRICRQLDGLPLALELAAARVPLLGVAAIAERLESGSSFLRHSSRAAPERHRTIQETVEWSHRLLSPAERVLFRRLAVFRGSFSLAAVEGVCTDDALTPQDALNVLGDLVDQSLVQVLSGEAEPRYRLLETIRRFAMAKLHDSDEAHALRRAHAGFFSALAGEAGHAAGGVERIRWTERLELERDNFREAMDCLLAHDPGGALSLACALWPFWYQRGYYREARAWFEHALPAPADVAPEVRADGLLKSGEVTFLLCDYELAAERLHEVLRLLGEDGDARTRASAFQRLGTIAREQARYGEARAWHERSLAIRESMGDAQGVAVARNFLGFVAWLEGNGTTAEALCGAALEAFRQGGDIQEMAGTLVNLGATALYSGDLARATDRLEQALAAARRVGFQEGIAWSLHELAIVARRRRAGVPEQAWMLRDALLIHHQLGDRWRLASVLEEAAGSLLARRDARAAVSVLAFVDRLRASMGAPVPAVERPDHDAALERVGGKLGRAGFAAAWSAGVGWELEQAVDVVLGALDHLAGMAPASDNGARPASVILTSRELAVLDLLSDGLTNREIASALYISPSTAAVHVSNILRKLGAKRRVDATGLAHSLGLLPVG